MIILGKEVRSHMVWPRGPVLLGTDLTQWLGLLFKEMNAFSIPPSQY